MKAPFPRVPLRCILRRSEDPVAIEPDVIYNQVTVRLFHRGVVLRGKQAGSEIRTTRQWRIRAGQLLLSRIDARNGAIGLVPPELNGAIVTNDFWAFDVDRDAADPGFLDAYFGTREFVEACKRASEGTTNRVRLQPKRFLDVEVPLPLLGEQRRIVARVEELVKEIQEARKARHDGLEKASEIFRSIIRQRYRALLSQRNGVPMAALVTVIGGGTPSKSNPLFWEGDVPWVSPKDMKIFRLANAQDHISESAIQQSATNLIEPGAVLVVIRGMILVHSFPVAVAKVPLTINQDMKALVPRPGIDPDFLAYMIRGAEQDVLGMVERSSHDTRRLAIGDLLSVHIPVIEDSGEQHGVVAHLDELSSKCEAIGWLHAETCTELDSLLPAVLRKVFDGGV